MIRNLEEIKTKGHNLIEVLNCSNAKETISKVIDKVHRGDLSNLCIGDYIPLENGQWLVLDVL